jgi:hypothetical protein
MSIAAFWQQYLRLNKLKSDGALVFDSSSCIFECYKGIAEAITPTFNLIDA